MFLNLLWKIDFFGHEIWILTWKLILVKESKNILTPNFHGFWIDFDFLNFLKLYFLIIFSRKIMKNGKEKIHVKFGKKFEISLKIMFFTEMKYQGYWCIFIRIMRKSGFLVKGYPFDWKIWRTKSFHNHLLNLIKSGLLKMLSHSKLFGRTKWPVFLELWWKKIEKVDSKFIWFSIFIHFHQEIVEFPKEKLFCR